ncbi:hypothetical protein BLA13014_04105 [Burkholderia aenigmatica]|uniref:Uncharacterized protein n=1 Tax=Burkholderia aenigmatica TaxID=2015348 RepID=A0A6P2MSC9_9BURK|nr:MULTISPECIES: hypothetical protein [Burkholderia]VWB88671.1 hypothetical protein BLA13014_04105 [Burkholderia aenigmatica]
MSQAPALPSPDQVRAIRIGALELLLQIEQTGVYAEPEFLATLHEIAQNPVRKELRRFDLIPPMEAAR